MAERKVSGTVGGVAPKAPSARARRGRPHKFGRPSQVVALTLPLDVVEGLRSMHADLAWAIVRLVERSAHGPAARRRREASATPAELVELSGARALIVVQPRVFAGLRGVSTIPLADGRAFLAFEDRGGIADLEVAILDRIDELPQRSDQRRELAQVRDLVKTWRRESGLVFRTSHIIVAENLSGRRRRTRAGLEVLPGKPGRPNGR